MNTKPATAGVLLLAACIVFGPAPAVADATQEAAALIALDRAYAERWIDSDAEGVLRLFTADATLVPHHGDAPVEGRDAIRDFWFNPDYPPTVIVEWQRTAQEVLVLGDTGIVRGRARLVWEFGGKRTTIPDGNYVMIATRGGDGWRIRMLTWNDDPRLWIVEPPRPE